MDHVKTAHSILDLSSPGPTLEETALDQSVQTTKSSQFTVLANHAHHAKDSIQLKPNVLDNNAVA